MDERTTEVTNEAFEVLMAQDVREARARLWTPGTGETVFPWDRDRDRVEKLVEVVNEGSTNETTAEVETRVRWSDLGSDLQALREAMAALGEGKVAAVLGAVISHEAWRRDCIAREKYGEGRCRHGVYVGGMGADYMCGACEDGAL